MLVLFWVPFSTRQSTSRRGIYCVDRAKDWAKVGRWSCYGLANASEARSMACLSKACTVRRKGWAKGAVGEGGCAVMFAAEAHSRASHGGGAFLVETHMPGYLSVLWHHPAHPNPFHHPASPSCRAMSCAGNACSA